MSDTNDTKGSVAYDASDAIVLGGKAQRLLASAKDYVIDSPTMYELAADDLRSVNAQIEMLLRRALDGAGRLPRDVRPPRRPGRPRGT